MADAVETTTEAVRPPLVKRLVDFPLVAMFVAAALVIALQVALGVAFAWTPATVSEWAGGVIPALVTVAAAFALYKLAIRHMGERRHDDLDGHGAGRQLGIGVLAGFLIMSAAVGVAAILGVYGIVAFQSGGDMAMIVFQAGIFAGFMEELLFRGILFRWIEEFAGSWAALAVTSLLFGLAHAMNPNATVLTSVAIMFEAGILLGAVYMLYRSLWVAIGLHFAWNVTQGFIYDVPVSGIQVEGLVEARLSGPDWLSGGTFGLEGSVIALVICTAAGVWVLRKAVLAGQVMQPRWVRRRSEHADQTKL